MLDDFRRSRDPTVRFVTQAVWYHYDDCLDHVVTLSKTEWDYFQRLLLLLESERQIVITSMPSLVLDTTDGSRLFDRTGLLHLASGVGPTSLGSVHSFRACLDCHFDFADQEWYLRSLRRNSGTILEPYGAEFGLSSHNRFHQDAVPAPMSKRRIRSRLAEFGLRLQFYLGWLLVSPIPLFLQTLPLKETRTQVKEA